MKEGARITISELPPRPRGLDQAEISRIFGGCNYDGASCGQDKDCCSGKCYSSQSGFQALAGGGSGYCYPAYRY